MLRIFSPIRDFSSDGFLSLAVPHAPRHSLICSSVGSEDALNPKPQRSNKGPHATSNAPSERSHISYDNSYRSKNIGERIMESPELNWLKRECELYPDRVLSISVSRLSTFI